MVDANRRADAPPPRIQYERHPGAACAPLAAVYRRREPEKTVLYAIVRDHLETFLEQPRGRDGDGYPAFLEREFRRYLHCGLLARGFARLRCTDCGFERLVAFSCKGRLCPSCMGRRMADIAAYLVVTFRIARRLTDVVERLSADDDQTEAVLESTAAALREAFATALEPPLPRLGRELDPPAMSAPLCAKIAGFSLHAARVVDAHDRDALESLCRYGLRAPFSQQRLTLRHDGRVLYHLRRPWPNAAGASDLVLEPCELLRRLAALVPAPYAHLVRYHGVFGNRSRWRARLPEPPNKDTDLVAQPRATIESESAKEPDLQAPAASPTTPAGSRTASHRRRSLPWAQLLRRVFFLDALTCPRCDAPMLVLALLSEPEVLRKILLHLGLPADLPTMAPARRTGEPLFDDDCTSAAPARPPPEGRGSYDGRGQFRSWLFAIATRLARDAHRQRRRRADLLQQNLVSTNSLGSGDDAIEGALVASIKAALADLPSDYAVAFHLRIHDGFSYREMAAICDAPQGTLRSRVHHVIRRLRQALQSDPSLQSAVHRKEKDDARESS